MGSDKENAWESSLEVGKEFETLIIEDIRNKRYPLAHENNSSDYSVLKLYDVIIPEINREIELKNDIESKNSGNICIEVGCNGNKSGLLVTKAKYWIHGDGNYHYLMLTNNIKKLIKELYLDKYPDHESYVVKKVTKYPVKQKDNNVKYMDFYLIRKDVFAAYSLEFKDAGMLTYEKLI